VPVQSGSANANGMTSAIAAITRATAKSVTMRLTAIHLLPVLFALRQTANRPTSSLRGSRLRYWLCPTLKRPFNDGELQSLYIGLVVLSLSIIIGKKIRLLQYLDILCIRRNNVLMNMLGKRLS
jgi:hypothetical protein